MELNQECPPTYRSHATIVILGEAPGADEVEKGEGFVGRSGMLLDKLLRAAGLDREQVSLSNVVKRRPPSNNFAAAFYQEEKIKGKKTLVPTEELHAWHWQLHSEIALHQPKVIVACGNEALYAVMGLRGIASRRGSCWKREDGTWVVAMLHPAYLLRGQWQEIGMAVRCLLRAERLAMDPAWEQPRYEVEALSDSADVVAMLHQCTAAEQWALDLETIPGDGVKPGTIAVLGVAWRERDVTKSAIIAWPNADVWKFLRAALASNPNVVGHNLVYDWAWLQQVNALPRAWKVPFDTMHRWHCLNPELPKAIDFATAWAIGDRIPYWKDEGKKLHKKKRTPAEQIQYWQYCAKDCVGALWLAEWIVKEEQKQQPVQWRGSNWRVAVEMQERGLQVDRMELVQVDDAVQDALEVTRRELGDLAPGINPASSKQIMDYLYGELKLPVQTKGQRRTADEEALRQLHRKKPTPFVAALLRFRKIEQLRKMFMVPLRKAACRGDETLYCGWTPDATETFRFSSSGHPLGGGLNAQTIPKSLRYLIMAPPGRVFLQPDLSQAEARYVAYRSRNQRIIDLFNDPTRSIHLERAKEIFGRELDKEKDDLLYRRAKSAVHAANYREGPKRLSLQLSISQAEAKQMLHRAQDQAVLCWHEEVRNHARTSGRLKNCWGQERQCWTAAGMLMAVGKIGEPELKELVAWEPQSAIPQIINQAIMRIKALSETGKDEQWYYEFGDEVWFHAHGHDSFLASVPVAHVQQWAETMMNILTIPCVIEGRELVIPVEMQVGWRWGGMVEWEPGWQDRCGGPLPAPHVAIDKALASLTLGQEE